MTLEDLFNDLYKYALQCGIKPTEFWDFTYGEIIDILDADKETKKQETKIQVMYNYQSAYLTSLFVVKLLNNHQIPTIYELYPDLFQEEKEEQVDNSWILYKEQMIDYAENHNRRLAK